MDALAIETGPYDRTRHEGFVKRSWCRGAREPWEALVSRLRRPETRCIVAHRPGDPETAYGWAAVDGEGAVIWVYVRDWPRTIRRRKVMTGLLERMGVDPSKPVPCLFWSPWAARLAARGYRFVYAPGGAKEAAA